MTTPIDTAGCGTGETRDRGPYLQVYSGKPFCLLDPRAEDVSPRDIAHSLSLQCRYMGHCKKFYSVAQHSTMVALLVPRELALIGLLHDAAEAYTGDITLPLKIAINQRAPGALQQITHDIERAIAERFGIPWALWEGAHDVVKIADNIALATERRDLMADTEECDWGDLPEPLFSGIIPLDPEQAEYWFLYSMYRISGVE